MFGNVSFLIFFLFFLMHLCVYNHRIREKYFETSSLCNILGLFCQVIDLKVPLC